MRRGALLLGVLGLLAGCGADAGDGARGTRTLRGPDGVEVRVPLEPRRIVSTLPGITECVAHLDGGIARLAAVSPHCDRPAEVAALPRVSVMPISLEAIAGVEPDLVLVDLTLLRTALPDLRSRFPGVLPLESGSLDGLARTIDLLAAALGTDGARERAEQLRRRLGETRREAASRRAVGRTVLLVGQFEPLLVLGPGSLLDDMVRACGLENIAADLGRASGPFASERVRAGAPDWILWTGDPFPESLRESWASLPAVRDGRVAKARADDLVRAGPRTVEALDRLSRVLAGELPVAALPGDE
jgi:ABC-type Fe3+-hydroxamate transport system substrate-binding protein